MYTTLMQRIRIIGEADEPQLFAPFTPNAVTVDPARSAERYIVQNGELVTTYPWYSLILDGPEDIAQVDDERTRSVKLDYTRQVFQARRAMHDAEYAYRRLTRY